MDLSVFYEIVVPLLEMAKSVLIMISTPVDSFNFYSELCELRDPSSGQRILQVFEVELVCAKCKQSEHPEQCHHNDKYVPEWKSVARRGLVAQMMKNQPSTLMRESMYVAHKPLPFLPFNPFLCFRGVITDSGNPLMGKELIREWNELEPLDIDRARLPKSIVVALDPNTSSKDGACDMAIASVCINRGHVVVRGVVFYYLFT